MKTPGDYALLHANGTSFREIVNMIRVETMEWYAAQQEARPDEDTLDLEKEFPE